MNEETFLRLAAVGLLVAANGFFVAAEFALVTVRRTRIEQLISEGNSTAKVVGSALTQLDRYIAGTQIGITLASLALGWIGEPTIAYLLTSLFEAKFQSLPPTLVHTISIGVGFTIITFLHVILGELVPKSLALQKPETTSLVIARPLALIVVLFRPLIWSLNGLGNLILSLIGLKTAGHETVHSTKELELLIRESHKAGILDDLEKHMLQRTFRFSDTSVGEIMVPRSEMEALDLSASFEQLLDKAMMTGYSRMPTYKESIDKINGVIYIHDLFKASRGKNPKIQNIIRAPLFVPETLRLDDMIEHFREHNTQIAIVVDEYGGTAGIVTLDDIMQAIFGRIGDHNKNNSSEALSIVDGPFTLPGETRLVELTESFNWTFDNTGGVDTLGGFVMHRLGRIPRVGDEVSDGERKYRVTKMDHYRVEEVEVLKD